MTSPPRLRPVEPRDHAAVLDLNERHVELLSPMDADRLAALLDLTDLALVVEADGEVAGFTLCFAPGTDYDSHNYRWYADRFGGDDFYYLDRVVVDDRFRRRGIGGLVYDAVEARAGAFGWLALEVNSAPPNEASLAFHAHRGFVEVGRLGDPGSKEVAMLVKELPFPEVRAMWAGDRASASLGMQLHALGPGRATVRMPVRADMCNGHGIGHGGLTFAVADSAFALACNAHGPTAVAHSAEVRFRAPVHEGDLLEASAVERELVDGRGVYDVEVHAGDRLVASFVGRSSLWRG